MKKKPTKSMIRKSQSAIQKDRAPDPNKLMRVKRKKSVY